MAMLKHPIANVKHPVKALDPSTNYYGKLRTKEQTLQKEVDNSFTNMHGNLLNSPKDNHEDTQGETNKVDRLKAIARRTGKVY